MVDLKYLGSDFTTDAIATLEEIASIGSTSHVQATEFVAEVMLSSILRRQRGTAILALDRMGIQLPDLQRSIESSMFSPGKLRVNICDPLVEARRLATLEAASMGSGYKGTEHLLLGALRAAEPDLKRLLETYGLTYERARKTVLALIRSSEDCRE